MKRDHATLSIEIEYDGGTTVCIRTGTAIATVMFDRFTVECAAQRQHGDKAGAERDALRMAGLVIRALTEDRS
jgi:hypothetical protein